MNATTSPSKNPLDLFYRNADRIFSAFHASQPARDLSDFVDSVRWDEPFIRALLAAQVVLLALTCATRRRDAAQFSILLLLTVVALSAERLNRLGKRNWRRFATQDYFDSRGLFMLTFVSGPFILLANYIVLGMLLRLVKVYAKKSRVEAIKRHRESQTRETKKTS